MVLITEAQTGTIYVVTTEAAEENQLYKKFTQEALHCSFHICGEVPLREVK